MQKTSSILIFSLLFSLNAESSGLVRNRYFRTVPLSEAHVVFGQARDLSFERDSIKVLVWNVKKAARDSWRNEFDQLAQGRDLFVLQEAYDDARFLNTALSYNNFRWDMGKSFTYVLYDNHATGSMIGSRVEPTNINVLHTFDLEPATKTPKAMTMGTYPIKGEREELLVISIHAINFTSLDAFERNLDQARDAIVKHKGPVLIAGDFNTRTKDRTRNMFKLMAELKMKTVIFKNADQRMKAPLTKNYLDHGFVRGLQVKNAVVIGEADGSDHKPMVLEMSLPKRDSVSLELTPGIEQSHSL